MDSNTIAHCIAICASVAGAAWAIRSKLSDLETVLRVHVESDAGKFSDHDARIIKLEGRRKR